MPYTSMTSISHISPDTCSSIYRTKHIAGYNKTDFICSKYLLCERQKIGSEVYAFTTDFKLFPYIIPVRVDCSLG